MASTEKHYPNITWAQFAMAKNIIAMLFESNETDYAAYAPYIHALSSSTNPYYCMAVASAKLRLGRTEEADLYAYKALYYLNDTEDYEIYKSYFGYYCRLPRYLTKPRQRRSEWDMAGSDGISRVSAVFRGKSLLTNKMRII